MKHPHRIGLTVAIGAALCLPMLAVTTAATAHEGHDDTARPPALQAVPEGHARTTARRADRPRRAARRRVLHTDARRRQVWLHDPATGLKTRRRPKLTVYSHDEEGLQSIALGPELRRPNRWVYLYYSPPLDTPVDDPATPTVNEGDAPGHRHAGGLRAVQGLHPAVAASSGPASTIDLGTEQKILDVPVDRGLCCHVGGDIVFDAAGNLLLSTGDDTNPFESDGYAPIDERPDRNPAFDAQRTAGQHQRPARQGPADHGRAPTAATRSRRATCSAGHDPKTRPRSTRWACATRSGSRSTRTPASSTSPTTRPTPARPNPLRGPAGQGKWTVVDASPATTAGPTARPPSCPTTTTTSPPARRARSSTAPRRSTTRRTTPACANLPPVTQPDVWYSYGRPPSSRSSAPAASARWPARRTSSTPRWPRKAATDRLAAVLRRRAAVLRVDARLHQGVLHRRRRRDARSRPSSATLDFDNPMDIEFGPDGALYVLEYGDGYFGKNLPGAELSRDRLHRPARQPQRRRHRPTADADRRARAPLTVALLQRGRQRPGRHTGCSYAWDFDADGKVDCQAGQPGVHLHRATASTARR